MTVPWELPEREAAALVGDSGTERRPAGLCTGAGHVIVYGNAAFVSEFGRTSIGLPARESMIGLPPAGFALFDAVLGGGRPLARWVRLDGTEWRLTAIPRPRSRDPRTLRRRIPPAPTIGSPGRVLGG